MEEQKQAEKLSIEERFVKFYERQTGGGLPDEKTVKLFLELANEMQEEEAT